MNDINNHWWHAARACGYNQLETLLADNESITDRLNASTVSFLLTSNGRIIYETDFYGEGNEMLIPGVYAELSEYIKSMPQEFTGAINQLIERTCRKEKSFFMNAAHPSDCGELLKRLSLITNYDDWILGNQPKPRFKKVDEVKDKADSVVYFIKAENGLVKIGCTANLEQRIRALSSMSPCKLELIHAIRSDEHYKLERKFHEEFESKRIHGEWFDLSAVELMAVKDRYSLDLSVSEEVYKLVNDAANNLPA
ncbi:MAG: GIY-YIG nuclease family protein [Lachnospiraceae bacterium]